MKKTLIIVMIFAMLLSCTGCAEKVAEIEIVDADVEAEELFEEIEEIEEAEEDEEDDYEEVVYLSSTSDDVVRIISSSSLKVIASTTDTTTDTTDDTSDETEEESKFSIEEDEMIEGVYYLYDEENQVLSLCETETELTITIIDYSYEISNLLDESLFDLIYESNLISYKVNSGETINISEEMAEDLVAFINAVLSSEYTTEDIQPIDSDSDSDADESSDDEQTALTLEILQGAEIEIELTFDDGELSTSTFTLKFSANESDEIVNDYEL